MLTVGFLWRGRVGNGFPGSPISSRSRSDSGPRNKLRFGILPQNTPKAFNNFLMFGAYNGGMIVTDFLLSMILLLWGAVGYFIKRILDRTDKNADDVGEIKNDVSDIRQKISTLYDRA